MSEQQSISEPALQGHHERYRLLVRLAYLINSSLDLREVFQRMASEIHSHETGPAELVVPARARRHRAEPRPRVRQRSGPGRGAVHRFGGHGRRLGPATTADRVNHRLDQAPGFADERHLFAQGYRSCVWLPLICRNQSLAVLGLASRDDKGAAAWDLSFLRDLCNLLATAVDNTAAYRQIARLKTRLEDENVQLREEIRTGQGSTPLIGTSPAMQHVHRAIAQVAGTDSTVLILGETGTGKELVAQAIHEQSRRREQLTGQGQLRRPGPRRPGE